MTDSIKPIDVIKDVTQSGKHYTNRVMTGDGFALGISIPHPSDFSEWVEAVRNSGITLPPRLRVAGLRQWVNGKPEQQYAQYYERLTQLAASYSSVRVTQASHAAKMATCAARLLSLIEETRKVDQLLYKKAGLGDTDGLPL